MSDQSSQTSVKTEKSGLGCLFPFLGAVALLVFGYVATLFTAPERLANANSCIGPRKGEPIYENTCNQPIHLEYCFFSQAGPEKDMCRITALHPGEGLDRQVLNDDLAEVGGLFRESVYACKQPYAPGQFEHRNTHRMTAGCVRPDDPHAGDHISR